MYYRDRRTDVKESSEIKKFQEYLDEEEISIEIPMRRIVCPTCGGEGRHVNPSIDAGGISPETFYDDPDFASDYFSGVYDVTCYECKGLRVVDVVDEEKLEKQNQDVYREWKDWMEGEISYSMEVAAERRMGA